MNKILVSWIGGSDLAANLEEDARSGLRGPVQSTLLANKFSKAYLLYNYPKDQVAPYLEWLEKEVADTAIQAIHCKLSSPIHFGDIHQAADDILSKISNNHQESSLNILLSPGTPAMQAVWILLGKTRYPAVFYQSSVEQGVQKIDIPFDIAAEYIPQANKITSSQLVQLTNQAIPPNAAFNDILTRNHRMNILKAQVLAQKDVPVLINGETGTGKELFARAI